MMLLFLFASINSVIYFKNKQKNELILTINPVILVSVLFNYNEYNLFTETVLAIIIIAP